MLSIFNKYRKFSDINIVKRFSHRDNFKILSIDGGGLKIIFSVYAIKQLKEEYNIDLFDEFDMFVGTSAGAILIVGILLKSNFEEIYRKYVLSDTGIFSEKNQLLTQFQEMFYPQFGNKMLNDFIYYFLEDLTFEELEKQVKKPFVFTSTNATEAKPIFFTSSHFKFSNKRYLKLKVREAIYASSAAPFYFEPIIENYTNHVLLDGGLWANNPALLAIILAGFDLNVSLKKMSLLSFGQTATENLNIKYTKGKESISFKQNPVSKLFTASFGIRQNFDSFASFIILRERIFRYVPQVVFPENKISTVSKDFIEYIKEYWEENKEELVSFIREGKNLNFRENDPKRFN